jgi:hypothetical protein
LLRDTTEIVRDTFDRHVDLLEAVFAAVVDTSLT